MNKAKEDFKRRMKSFYHWLKTYGIDDKENIMAILSMDFCASMDIAIKQAKKEVINDLKKWIDRKGSRLNNQQEYDNCINDLSDFYTELKRSHNAD